MIKIDHLCIQTKNYHKSKAFYCQLFEFEVIKETKNFHNRDFNTWLKNGDFKIELQTGKKDHALTSFSKYSEGIAHFSIMVDDVEKEYQRLKALADKDLKTAGNKGVYYVNGTPLLKIIAPEGTIIEIRDQNIKY